MNSKHRSSQAQHQHVTHEFHVRPAAALAAARRDGLLRPDRDGRVDKVRAASQVDLQRGGDVGLGEGLAFGLGGLTEDVHRGPEALVAGGPARSRVGHAERQEVDVRVVWFRVVAVRLDEAVGVGARVLEAGRLVDGLVGDHGGVRLRDRRVAQFVVGAAGVVLDHPRGEVRHDLRARGHGAGARRGQDRGERGRGFQGVEEGLGVLEQHGDGVAGRDGGIVEEAVDELGAAVAREVVASSGGVQGGRELLQRSRERTRGCVIRCRRSLLDLCCRWP